MTALATEKHLGSLHPAMIFSFGPYLETAVSARCIRLSETERANLNSGSRGGALLLKFTASVRVFFARPRKYVLASASAILASSILTLSSNWEITRLFLFALATGYPIGTNLAVAKTRASV